MDDFARYDDRSIIVLLSWWLYALARENLRKKNKKTKNGQTLPHSVALTRLMHAQPDSDITVEGQTKADAGATSLIKLRFSTHMYYLAVSS